MGRIVGLVFNKKDEKKIEPKKQTPKKEIKK